MSYGKTEQPCSNYRAWIGQEPLCGNCGWNEEDHSSHNPIAEQKARTIEAIVKMLPEGLPETSQIHTADLRTMSSTQIWIEKNKGANQFRSEVIALLPQIVEIVEKGKMNFLQKNWIKCLEEADKRMKSTNGHQFVIMLKTRCYHCGKSEKVKTKCGGWFHTFLENLRQEIFK